MAGNDHSEGKVLMRMQPPSVIGEFGFRYFLAQRR